MDKETRLERKAFALSCDPGIGGLWHVRFCGNTLGKGPMPLQALREAEAEWNAFYEAARSIVLKDAQ